MKQVKLRVALCLSILLLAGCADKIEVEEEGFVLVIGVDLPEEGGTGYDITFQMADPQAGNPGSQPGSAEFKSLMIRVPDLIAARDMLNISETRNINFYHTKALIISEELARSDKFLEVLSTIARDTQSRRDMNLLVSKERANKFLNHNHPAFEASPHKFYDFVTRRWENNSLVPRATLHTIIHDTEADAGLALAIYATTEENVNLKTNEDNYLPGEMLKEGGTPVQIIGAAAFRDGKMVGSLTGEAVRARAMLTEHLQPKEVTFTFPDPLNEEFRVTGKLTNTKTKVKVDVSNPTPDITVDVWLSVKILGIPSMINYVEDSQKQEVLDDSLEKRFKERADELVEKTQTELKAEAFNWSLAARKKFFTVKEYQEYDWMHSYPDAKVKIKVHTNIESFGKILRPRSKEAIID
ncbi:Ger(x)C family spore germination protein [Rossellomorea vietnamensis]|uniref:Ger(X)C family spore germination protein n=1 Tax=Rossellomorea vietnamensis TaxID=218284 RepID=A0A5D4KFK9_9BACI|nr:Ger(x)C family spore germination protein [Rossellomorea vietnamensis]